MLERWFGKKYRTGAPGPMAMWRSMLSRTPVAGYAGCCAAIRDTDLRDSTARLTLPTLAIGGDEDGSTPPDLVRVTVDLIPGSQFHLIRRAGHIPCVEQPEEYAERLTAFLRETGHIG